jgi:hypothetical protein
MTDRTDQTDAATSPAEAVAQAIAGLAAQRDELLAGLGDLQAMTGALRQHEATRLARTLGAEHPRAQEAATRAARTLGVSRTLAFEAEVARIVVPPAPEGQALVHGRVTDAGLRGVGGVTVALSGKDGQPLHLTESTETERTGAFALAVDPAILEEVGLGRTGVFLAAYTPRGQLLARTFDPIRLAPGGRTLVELVVDRLTVAGQPREERSTSAKPSRAKAARPPAPAASAPAPAQKRRTPKDGDTQA